MIRTVPVRTNSGKKGERRKDVERFIKLLIYIDCLINNNTYIH